MTLLGTWRSEHVIQPHELLTGPLPAAMVAGDNRTITINWEPYDFERTNALIIRNGSGTAVAVEQDDARSFSTWLMKQALYLMASRL